MIDTCTLKFIEVHTTTVIILQSQNFTVKSIEIQLVVVV